MPWRIAPAAGDSASLDVRVDIEFPSNWTAPKGLLNDQRPVFCRKTRPAAAVMHLACPVSK